MVMGPAPLESHLHLVRAFGPGEVIDIVVMVVVAELGAATWDAREPGQTDLGKLEPFLLQVRVISHAGAGQCQRLDCGVVLRLEFLFIMQPREPDTYFIDHVRSKDVRLTDDETLRQGQRIDAISGGRLTLGLGVGSRKDDFGVAPAEFRGRGKRFESQLELMKEEFEKRLRDLNRRG